MGVERDLWHKRVMGAPSASPKLMSRSAWHERLALHAVEIVCHVLLGSEHMSRK
jgi:hypothetical protein